MHVAADLLSEKLIILPPKLDTDIRAIRVGNINYSSTISQHKKRMKLVNTNMQDLYSNKPSKE